MIDTLTAVLEREAGWLLRQEAPLTPEMIARLEALCRAYRALRLTGNQAPPAEPPGDLAELEKAAGG